MTHAQHSLFGDQHAAWPTPLLTVEQMGQADAATIAAGTPGIVLMENAGAAVVAEIVRRWSARPAVVLCGPGNNGGDGFVIARLLRHKGWDIRLYLMGDVARLNGDAALAAAEWGTDIIPLTGDTTFCGANDDTGLVVDALFGAGLTRPVEGVAEAAITQLIEQDVPVVAVDMPSGVDGNSGEVRGVAFRADLTVTFCRPKIGHVLLPGRIQCGELVVADIGIPDRVVEGLNVQVFHNSPALWRDHFPRPSLLGHKYSRGHALVVGGGAVASGAARMAAQGALRAGAGLVTALAPGDALAVYAAHLTSVMLDDIDNLPTRLEDPRCNAVLIGPGCGVNTATAQRTLAALAAGKRCVIDADAITSLKNEPAKLFAALSPKSVLTPHEGEFSRLFDFSGDKRSRAGAAASLAGAVVVLKGGDTIVAAPDGRASINTNAPAQLATAGAGDVLAGFILGLIAQGMPSYEAACAGTWLHGAAAAHLSHGLIAEDLPEALPAVLSGLLGAGNG
jgi:NAD(P)H-hydrate epimerase